MILYAASVLSVFGGTAVLWHFLSAPRSLHARPRRRPDIWE